MVSSQGLGEVSQEFVKNRSCHTPLEIQPHISLSFFLPFCSFGNVLCGTNILLAKVDPHHLMLWALPKNSVGSNYSIWLSHFTELS